MRTAGAALRDGDHAEALQALEAALEATKKLDPKDPRIGATHNRMARTYGRMRRIDKAEFHFRQSLQSLEKALGKVHPVVALAYGDLGNFYRVQRQYEKAEPLLKQALEIARVTIGGGHPESGKFLNNLGAVYSALGRYGEAVPVFLAASDNWRKSLGEGHPLVGTVFNNLGDAYRAQGQYSKAEHALKKSLDIREKGLGSDDPEVSITLNNLAAVFRAQGRYVDAESHLRRALAIREEAFGDDDPRVATVVNNLAELIRDQGRYGAAEPLLNRSLEILEKSLGGDSPRVGLNLINLGTLHRLSGKPKLAEEHFKRGVSVLEKSLGNLHPELATGLNNLAELYGSEGNVEEATQLYVRAMDIWERSLGPDHPRVGDVVNNVALLFQGQKLFRLAEKQYAKSLKIFETGLGKSHPRSGLVLSNLANLRLAQGQGKEALELIRRARDIFQYRIQGNNRRLSTAVNTRHNVRLVFERHVEIVHHTAGLSKGDHSKLFNEGFRSSQLALATGTSAALENLGARYAASDLELGHLIRAIQDEKEKWQRAEALLTVAAGLPSEKRGRMRLGEIQRRLEAQEVRIATLKRTMTEDYPKYSELTAGEPISIRVAQSFLAPDEAVLFYILGETKSYLWVLRLDQAELVELDVSRTEVSRVVRRLRKALDVPGAEDLASIPPFDVFSAHDLYQKIFVPARQHLDGIKHIMVVPDGALQSLPFPVLVTEEPTELVKTFEDYRVVKWIIQDYAFTTLPAISSLRVLRKSAEKSRAKRPFLGIGDPDLDGDSDERQTQPIESLFAARGGANVDLIRELPELPETEDELKAMAEILKAGDDALLLGDEATETLLKGRNLAEHKVIAFATHGLVGGAINGIGEPSLVLTPPDKATDADDGLLTASEISLLKMDADLVILSACNTAAPDGTPGADALSGLAKSFFHAGARSLLVSHWPVVSKAAVQLTTKMLAERTRDASLGHAASLQKSIQALLSGPEEVFAHPLFWAPFVVVGEGGA